MSSHVLLQHAPASRLARSATSPARPNHTVSRWAIVSASLPPIAGITGWLVADALQPTSYSPIRDTVSQLAGQTGTDRWVMTVALFLAGSCYLLTAASLAGIRRCARLLLVIAGLALIGIATSPEPASGPTARHLAWTVLGAITITVWPVFAARRGSPRPQILSVTGSVAVTVAFVTLLAWFFAEAQGGSMLGLAERVTTSVEASWPIVVTVALRRSARRTRLDVPDQASDARVITKSTTLAASAAMRMLPGWRSPGRRPRRPVGAPSPGRASERAGAPAGWAFGEATVAALHSVPSAHRDVRRYRPDPVPPELLRQVLAAGHQAPSVGHSQP
jgi:hypothetical membrane protein